MTEVSFEYIIEETIEFKQNTIYEDHNIIKSPIYDNDMQYFETGHFEDHFIMQLLITEIEDGFMCVLPNTCIGTNIWMK